MPKLDRSTGVYVVALVAIACAFAFGVLWLTPAPARGDLIGKAAAPLGSLVGLVGSLIAAKIAHEAKTETRSQTDTLDTIKRNTNGALTGGIREAVAAELDAREQAAAEKVGRHAVVVPVAAADDVTAQLVTDPAGAAL